MDYAKESLRLHGEWKGKIEMVTRVPVKTKDDLSLAYTPGVAQPCLEIQKDINKSYELTRRWNMAAVITDGSAVLGLGDIGPEAGMPVMEGKCVLFKAFGDVDAFPICVKTKDVDEFVETVYNISGSFGGINLEDIAAPRCFEIERKLKEKCDIPIFHDDQHGTAVITLAGLTNALKVVGKKKEDVKIVTSGAGAAAIAITKLLLSAGFPVVDVKATVYFGSYHEVDSNEFAFITCAMQCFKQGFLKAKPQLLEPMMDVEVVVPEQYMGAANGSINQRRGRVEGMDDRGGMKSIKATVPLGEMFGYSNAIRTVTQGRGTFTMIFKQYEPVPASIAKTVIEKRVKEGKVRASAE